MSKGFVAISVVHIGHMTKPVKTPGLDHPVSVERSSCRVAVTVAGGVLGNARAALILREASYPRPDADFTPMERTEPSCYCPYKAAMFGPGAA